MSNLSKIGKPHFCVKCINYRGGWVNNVWTPYTCNLGHLNMDDLTEYEKFYCVNYYEKRYAKIK